MGWETLYNVECPNHRREDDKLARNVVTNYIVKGPYLRLRRVSLYSTVWSIWLWTTFCW